MRVYLLISFLASIVVFVGCEYDNYEAPQSVLSGRVVYENEPVGVRTNGVELELWQSGYQLFEKIPVYVAHDGTFSAVLFDGEYKLVRLDGAPWENQSDTIIVNVKGNTEIEVPVKPYYILTEEMYNKSGNYIEVKFKILKVSHSASIERVRVYLGKSMLTDQNKHEGVLEINLSEYDLDKEVIEVSQKIEIPENLQKYSYVFGRIGVSSSKSNEFYYTQVERIEL